MSVGKVPPKKDVPPPGRKLSEAEALALANKQFRKTLSRLAR